MESLFDLVWVGNALYPRWIVLAASGGAISLMIAGFYGLCCCVAGKILR